MAKSEFKIAFYYEQTESNKLPKVEGETCPTTTCKILGPGGNTLFSASVTLNSKTVANRLVARKLAFEKVMRTLNNREIRRELWKIFRSDNIQPENGRIRLRRVESLIDSMPSVNKENATVIKNLLREACASVPKPKLVPVNEAQENVPVAEVA